MSSMQGPYKGETNPENQSLVAEYQKYDNRILALIYIWRQLVKKEVDFI